MICIHHDDIDGRLSAALVAEFENDYDQKHYIEANYNSPLSLDMISKDEKVYVVDYSFSQNTIETLEKLSKITKNIIWIDHHDSSFKILKDYPKYDKLKGIRKKGISGAALTYMYLYNKTKLEECPKYIQLVSDFDCWLYKFKEDTTHFKFGLESYDYSALSSFWMFMNDDKINEILKRGKSIYEYVKNTNLDYINKFAFECTFENLRCLAVNKRDNSEIFGDKINDYDIVSTFVYLGDKIQYSIFTTKNNIDCSKLAEKYGGGGHKQAAGFTIDELILRRS